MQSMRLRILPRVHDNSNPTDMFENPDKNCLSSPNNAVCQSKPTLQTLDIHPDFGVIHLRTSTIYTCDS